MVKLSISLHQARVPALVSIQMTAYYSTTPTTAGVTMSKSEYKKNCLFSASHWAHPEAHTEFGHAQYLVSQRCPLLCTIGRQSDAHGIQTEAL